MVRKLLSQRQRLGGIRQQYHRCGRKPLFDAARCRLLQDLVKARPDATLHELRGRCPKGQRVRFAGPHGLWCTLMVIGAVRLDGTTPAMAHRGSHRH